MTLQMKIKTALQLFVLCLVITTFSQCTRVDMEDSGIQKTAIFKHNYIAIATKDNLPGRVEVQYSVVGSDGKNEVKTQILSTPCLIGGEGVVVVYDSIVGKQSGKTSFSQLVLKRNYGEQGADFLSITNLSSSVIEYAVIGNQPFTFYPIAELTRFHHFTNIEEIDKGRVVKECPTPVSRNGVPVLYLLRPDLSSFSDFYAMLSVGKCEDNRLTSVSETYAKKIELNQPTLSIREIIDLYKTEYDHGNTLFTDYEDYDSKCKNSRGLSHLSMKHYGEIKPSQVLRNSGQIWFVNTTLGIRGLDTYMIYQ